MLDLLHKSSVPFVLVRNDNLQEWCLSIFSHNDDKGGTVLINHKTYAHVIPYEGNEHLLGTTYPVEIKKGD